MQPATNFPVPHRGQGWGPFSSGQIPVLPMSELTKQDEKDIHAMWKCKAKIMKFRKEPAEVSQSDL